MPAVEPRLRVLGVRAIKIHPYVNIVHKERIEIFEQRSSKNMNGVHGKLQEYDFMRDF